MGLIELLGGQTPSYLNDNRMKLAQFGMGMMGQEGIGGAIKGGLAGGIQGQQFDQQRQLQQQEEQQRLDAINQANQQKNRTLEYLQSQGRDDLLAAVEGGMSVGDAWKQALQPAPERKTMKGADGYNYFVDTGERVLPNVQTAPEAPDLETLYDPETGQPYKGMWNPETGQFDQMGGVKAPNGMQITTNPDGTVSVSQGMGKPLTEGQSKDVVYATRAEGASPILDQYEESLTNAYDQGAANVPMVGNFMTSEDFKKAKQAGLEFLQAILRKDTGAAITPQETAEYGKVYLPQPGDSEAIIQQKKASRKRAIEAIKAGMPPQAILAMEKQAIPQPDQPQDQGGVFDFTDYFGG